MKKLVAIAALLMASTAAHAGSGITFEIDGQRIRVEAPRHCNALSCIRISAPGYNGTLGKSRYPEQVLRAWSKMWNYEGTQPSIIIAPTRYLGDG